MKRLAAILLAAGRSRRMGAFKPLLPFGPGRTVIETCVANLRDAGVEEVVVVVGSQASEVRKTLAPFSVVFAVNDEAESEMGVSIARGVEAVSRGAEAVLISLADQPAISPRVIRSVIEARAAERATRFVVPEYGGRGGHPVLVDLAYREELLNLDPRGGLRALLEAHREEVLRVAVDSPYIARDMDTWDDYSALHEEVCGAPPPISPPPL